MGKWLTPDTPIANKTYTRRIDLPANAQFMGLLNAALLDLTNPSNFEQHGELTPNQTAAIFQTIYDQFIQSQNEPPYSDDAENLDGEDKQPWYDDLADWIIEAFLAITFTPGAAIVYSTTIPQMRVAFRKGNIGAAFRVLLNNLEIWTGDSYGPIPEILEQTLDLQQFAFDNDLGPAPWDVKIEHDGDTGEKLEVIRSGQPQSCTPGSNVMIGQILWGAWQDVPDHCLACDGANYLKSAYPDLWSVLDATYEYSPIRFFVPDLRGRAAIGNGQGSGLTDRAMNDSGGAEVVTLAAGEMPAHNHWATGDDPVGDATALLNQSGVMSGSGYGAVAANSGVRWQGVAVATEGGGQAHENMSPFNTLRAVIVCEA